MSGVGAGGTKYATHLTLSQMLVERARLSHDTGAYTFLRDGETDAVTVTWGEVDQRARAIAQALIGRSLAQERVVLLLPSGIDFLLAFFGCLHAAAVPVPLAMPRSARPEEMARLVRVIEDARPGLIITIGQVVELAGAFTRTPCALVDELIAQGHADR